MRSLVRLAVIITACLGAVDSARGQVPALPDIPNGLTAEAARPLEAKRAELDRQRKAVLDSGLRHNERCRAVKEGSPEHGECLASRERLNGEIKALRDAADKLEDEIDTAVAAERTRIINSMKDCSEIKQQLARDEEAMHRQQKAIEQGQAEFVEWTKKNGEAQKAALKGATSFLVDSLAAKLGEFTEGKLARLEADFKKRAPLGETWQRKIQKVQEFRAAEARLTGAVDGIKLAGFAGAAADGWRAGKEWAAKNGKDAATLDTILAEWERDPELQQIMKESGISRFSAGLGFSKTLAPWGTALDFGQFLVGYGYDATDWTLSKNRINQQIANRDQDLKAVGALKKQIERTVAKLKACKGE